MPVMVKGGVKFTVVVLLLVIVTGKLVVKPTCKLPKLRLVGDTLIPAVAVPVSVTDTVLAPGVVVGTLSKAFLVLGELVVGWKVTITSNDELGAMELVVGAVKLN